MNTCKKIISTIKELGTIMNISARIALGMFAFSACCVLPIFGCVELFEWLETINIL